MADDMMTFYNGDQPGGTPGLLPLPYYCELHRARPTRTAAASQAALVTRNLIYANSYPVYRVGGWCSYGSPDRLLVYELPPSPPPPRSPAALLSPGEANAERGMNAC